MYFRKGLVVILLNLFLLHPQKSQAQNYEGKSMVYNAFIGGFSGGVGAWINKGKNEKWHKAFFKGFLLGSGGGMLMYTGKKLNYLVAHQRSLGYAWLSRFVFSAGNSIVENAAANRPFWSVWHYDIGFIRVEFHTSQGFHVQPRLMFSTFLGTVFLAVNGRFDARTSLFSGTPAFRTPSIGYSSRFLASTPTNGFLLKDSLYSTELFHEVVAHEMIHAFQFQEYSGCNYFFKPQTEKWKAQSPLYARWSKWVYGDLNYEVMGINYFLIQKGHQRKDYCHNFLENEAESLSTGRSACP